MKYLFLSHDVVYRISQKIHNDIIPEILVVQYSQKIGVSEPMKYPIIFQALSTKGSANIFNRKKYKFKR